jgi:hypothetical protein
VSTLDGNIVGEFDLFIVMVRENAVLLLKLLLVSGVLLLEELRLLLSIHKQIVRHHWKLLAQEKSVFFW